jgi:iron transport multicopper oxidase
MALSLSRFLVSTLLVSSAWYGQVAAKTYDFNITWVRANPDGLAERPVIGINNQWPIPVLNFTLGENVTINIHNQVRIASCSNSHRISC